MRSNDEIIQIIKDRMLELDLSMSEVARRVGVAKSALSRYLNKTREFPLNKAEDFAKVLKLDPKYLLFDNNEDKVPKPNSSIETIAAHIDDDVTEEEMEDIVNYIEFIKSKKQ